MQVLLIEDDLRLAQHLVEALNRHGIKVDHISSENEISGGVGVRRNVDAVILDRLIGTFDTKSILPRLREDFATSHIVILSAINTPNERTELINLGADDYMGKPFATYELIARLKASSRRTAVPANLSLRIANLIVDTVNRTVSVNGETSPLPSKEFSLLRALCQEVGRVWSKGELLDSIWGQNALVETNVVEATVTNLRKKLAAAGAKIEIKNMRNAGYWVEE